MPKKRSVKGVKGGSMNQSSVNQSSQPLSSQTPNQVMVQGGPKPSVPKTPPNPMSQSNTMSQSNPEESSMFSSFTNMFDTSTMDTKQMVMYVGLFIVGIALTYALYSVLSSNNSSSKEVKDDEESKGEQETAAKMVESVVTAAVNASVNNSTSSESSTGSSTGSDSSTGSNSSTGSDLSTGPDSATASASSGSNTESFVNYIDDFVNMIFEPGRPDINEKDSNKLLPGYFNVGIEYNEKV